MSFLILNRGIAGPLRGRLGLMQKRMTSTEGWPEANVLFVTAFELTKELFEKRAVAEADLSARYLVCDAAEVGPRYSDFKQASSENAPLSTSAMERLKSHVDKRLTRMPVQYILGNWDFYGLTLSCKEPVLIPRPETEELVELLLKSKIIPENGAILDVGAGTGAVGLAILSQMSNVSCVALDVNNIAVNLAITNACAVLGEAQARYACHLQDFESYAKQDSSQGGTFDVIVSNPPYIPGDEMLELSSEVKDYEDHRALHGGEDGMDLIKKIIQLGPPLLSVNGPGELWLEVARRHPAAIEEYVREYNSKLDARGDKRRKFVFIEGIKDLSNNPRFVRLRLQ